MKIKVHGSRGSHPVGVSARRIEEISRFVWEFARDQKLNNWADIQRALAARPRSDYQIYGGNTTCLEIHSDHSPMPLFIDAGSGLASACMDSDSCLTQESFSRGRGEAAFFFTHTHWDHVSGLVTIPQLFMENNQFHFYGVHKNLRERLAGLFASEYFPVPFSQVEPRFHFHQMALNHSLRIGTLKVDHLAQSHPGGSFAYRFSDGQKTLVIATDTDLSNPGNARTPGHNLYSNADVLVVDAHFSPEDFVNKEDFGHTHVLRALDFAVQENAKMVYLFHQSPYYTDATVYQQWERAVTHLRQNYPESTLEVRMAHDGDFLDLYRL